jgi:hypothetical protein
MKQVNTPLWDAVADRVKAVAKRHNIEDRQVSRAAFLYLLVGLDEQAMTGVLASYMAAFTKSAGNDSAIPELFKRELAGQSAQLPTLDAATVEKLAAVLRESTGGKAAGSKVR